MGSHKNGLYLTFKMKNMTRLSMPCSAAVEPGDPAYNPATVHAPYLSLTVADVKLRCVMKVAEEAVT